MKNIFKTAALLLFIFTLSSCSLDRTNPLDPYGYEDITVPAMVQGILLSSTGGVVNIRWNRAEYVSKYRIYRSQSYDGKYEIIEEVSNPSAEAGNYVNTIDSNVTLMRYYYKLSAVNVQGLEGPRSAYKYILVRP
ncbi:MAG TPA: hypothetical protein PKZ69_06415 [Candidatus Cloacimonadota bacterium]|nr:hypothetical protein [Candidatus Cloacimonadota bacterium]HOQ80663.1 hypothetical protein [Candidatus Cloacimonadota bacterium]HPK41239.1 hypothetical protein [Candidatus Cloacimonadota bacterium]